MNNPLYDFDRANGAPTLTLCGVDEAGRGPLCGPVCCAAVILDYSHELNVDDSKKLSEKKRELLYDEIINSALAYKITLIDNGIIDEINILNATLLGMKQAVEQLNIPPDFVLVDGNKLPALHCDARAVIKGDGVSAAIAAASILAKVTRDRYMVELDKQYPQYQLARHKGYGTKLHYEMIKQHGVEHFYRRSFLKRILSDD